MGPNGFEMAASWKIFTFHTMGPRLDESSKFHGKIVGLIDVDVDVFSCKGLIGNKKQVV